MKVLVINCGSSSVKYQFINLATEEVLADGVAERIGEDVALFSYKTAEYKKKKFEMLIPDHEKAINLIIEHLTDEYHGVVKSLAEIAAVGHRLVHGGEFYANSVRINSNVIKVMEECSSLAPLHNPANLKGIEALTNILPQVPQCGVFDTAFHQTMPAKAYLYALPLELYKENKIRRYGFHGTSHKYVSQLAADYLGQDIKDLKIITAHIGNGASITAIDGGKSVDTSMGFTPLEGLMMGTRCGDIDPAIPLHMMKELDMSVDEVNNLLNKKSGMLGLSAISNDMREIEEDILERKIPEAIQAHDVYAYRIKKYIGAYAAAMNGLDILVFTGGVGENMPILRSLVCQDLDFLGIKIDENENDQFVGGTLDISAPESRAKILKIQTNEELMIAMETKRILDSEK
ncbi:MAG: acetate kinase [Candidatus Cloacimonadales bacterium]